MSGVRYYGFYSNKSRGLQKKASTDDEVPALIQSTISPKEFRDGWVRLIQKIYHVNPLLCPKCFGSMKIISFIKFNASHCPEKIAEIAVAMGEDVSGLSDIEAAMKAAEAIKKLAKSVGLPSTLSAGGADPNLISTLC